MVLGVALFLTRSVRVETPPPADQSNHDLPHLSEHLRVMYDSGSRGERQSRSVRNTQQQPYDIVLFHGLQTEDWQQAWWKTWSVGGSVDPKDWWPLWLAAEDQLGNQLNRVISVSWDSNAKDSRKITDFPLQVASLSNELCSELQQQPFFLIGHSLGGLVIKQLICYLHQKAEPSRTCPAADAAAAAKFLAKLKGVAFYGVPHTGAQLTQTARFIPGITNLVTDVLRPNSALSLSLVEKFDVFLAETQLPVLAVLESRKTHLVGPSGLVPCYNHVFFGMWSNGSVVLPFVKLSHLAHVAYSPYPGCKKFKHATLILLTERTGHNNGQAWKRSNHAEILSCCVGQPSTLASDVHCLLCRHQGSPGQ